MGSSKRIGFRSENIWLRRFGPYLLYGLITLLVTVLYLGNHRLFATWELGIQDTMIALGKRADPPTNVVVVTIDDDAIAKLGPWPWDSERLALLVGMLDEYEPKAIGLDLDLPTDFEEDPAGNQFLADMIAQSGKVFLPLRFTLAPEGGVTLGAPEYISRSALVTVDETRRLLDLPYLSTSGLSHPFEEACHNAKGTGHVNSWQDVDGRLRRDPLVIRHAGEYFPSLSLQLARAALGLHRTQVKLDPGHGVIFPAATIPTDAGGLFLIDYRGPAGTVPSISAARVLEGKVEPSAIAGKVVVVGVSASGYGTNIRTGVSDAMPRAEKIATVTANILDGRFITTVRLSTVLDILILFAIGTFCALALPRVTLLYRVVVLVVMALLFLNVNFVLYSSFKLITKTLFPTLEILLFLAISPVIKMRREDIALGTPRRTQSPSVPVSNRRARGSSPSSSSGRTPVSVDSNGVPVRKLVEDKPAGVISGLQKTMVIDLNTVSSDQGAGTAEIPISPPSDSQPQQPMSQTAQLKPEALDSISVDGLTPQPQPQDLMGHSPRPMGFTNSAPAEQPRHKDVESANLKRLGRYEVLGGLGEGAMGTVYKGKDPAIGRMVALKTILVGTGINAAQTAELRERLVREAKAAGKLSHPHIVTIYDVGTEGDLDYIAMEYLEGYTLEELIKKNVQVNYRITARILVQICDALEYAHSFGIVHRDIKPANVMVLEDFQVKVMDFGIARFDSAQMSMTQTGIAIGTPQYIAPELLRGQDIDRRCDIFSLGVVAYELLTGKRPFRGENISQLIYAITQTDPEPPTKVDENIPSLFDVIVGKALAKDPRERYQSAREMGQALGSFVEDLTKSKSSFRI